MNSFAFCFLVCVAFEIELERLSIPNSKRKPPKNLFSAHDSPKFPCFLKLLIRIAPVADGNCSTSILTGEGVFWMGEMWIDPMMIGVHTACGDVSIDIIIDVNWYLKWHDMDLYFIEGWNHANKCYYLLKSHPMSFFGVSGFKGFTPLATCEENQIFTLCCFFAVLFLVPFSVVCCCLRQAENF